MRNQTSCSDDDLLGQEELGNMNRNLRTKEKDTPKGCNCLIISLNTYNHSRYTNHYARYKQEHKDS